MRIDKLLLFLGSFFSLNNCDKKYKGLKNQENIFLVGNEYLTLALAFVPLMVDRADASIVCFESIADRLCRIRRSVLSSSDSRSDSPARTACH